MEHLHRVGKLYSPEETCGIFLGDETKNKYTVHHFVWINNISSQPGKWDFKMGSELGRLIMGSSWGIVNNYYALSIVGIWHTHPNLLSKPVPSNWDIKYAKEFEAEVPWIIHHPESKKTKGWLWVNKNTKFKQIKIITED